MNEAIAGQYFTAVQTKGRSVEPRHGSARLQHEKDACSGIPRVEIEFPVPVIAAAGNVGEVEGRRTGAAHAVRRNVSW